YVPATSSPSRAPPRAARDRGPAGTRAPRASPLVAPGPPGRAPLESGARRPRAQLLPHVLHGLGGRERALGTAGLTDRALPPPLDRRPSRAETDGAHRERDECDPEQLEDRPARRVMS